jgi:hypothetical protein
MPDVFLQVAAEPNGNRMDGKMVKSNKLPYWFGCSSGLAGRYEAPPDARNFVENASVATRSSERT